MTDPVAHVLQALDALYTQAGADPSQKSKANQFLEEFQKGTESWKICHQILEGNYPEQAKVFSAQTLRSKISYDFYQVPDASRMELKSSLINLLENSIKSSKIVARQLSIALANLALQYVGWQNVIPEMVSKFGESNDQGLGCLLEFLKVLPEELGDSQRTSLSDDEFRDRTKVLISDNVTNVIELLVRYTQNTSSDDNKTLIFECLNSWMKEISIEIISNSPLVDLVFTGLRDESTFEPAVECICTVIGETKDVVDTVETIKLLYPKVIALRPQISQSKDDEEQFRGYTKIFSGAGEAWHVLIAQRPREFRELVECIAECTAFDEDLDVVQYTFYFWYLLKEMLVLSKFAESRRYLGDVYEKLIDVIIHHLHYPSGPEEDLFNGDKEEEEKFRSFRHEMGDVLKDCCSVVGSTLALRKAYDKVYQGLQNSNSSWQEIEAPLFSMRAMAREVELTEDEILPNIMKLLVQLPEHEKIRYAATLVLGRYTEWTAKHPNYLDFQLQYITNGFDSPSRSVMNAAAQALMHFCQDCADLLTTYLEQLHPFYAKIAGELDLEALYEVTDGIAHVIVAQPIEQVLPALQHFAEPIVRQLLAKTSQPGEDKVYRGIADEIELLTIFVNIVQPVHHGDKTQSPTAKFVVELYPNMVLPILQAHGKSTFVAERTSKFIKTCLHSCGVGLQPILAQIAETLVSQFEQTQYGCYLWVSGALVREFGDDMKDEISPDMREAVWDFAYRQAESFFRQLSSSKAEEVPDLVEDFFRLMGDILIYMPFKHIMSDLFQPSFEAAMASLTLEQVDPLTSTLHFLQDLFGFGSERPPTSLNVGLEDGKVPQQVRERVAQLATSQGHLLCARIISGLIYTFPRDCVTDASSLVLTLIQLVPNNQALEWISHTLDLLPEGTVSGQEKSNLLTKVDTALNSGDFKRVRTLLRDFTALYARRNITPRSQHMHSSIEQHLGEFSYQK